MSADILPFPLVRRRAYIMKQAAWLNSMGPKGAETTLRCQMERQRTSLLAKGVEPERVDAEVKAAETAIRVAMALEWLSA